MAARHHPPTHTAVAARMNAEADDRPVAVYLPIAIAESTIRLAGGGRPVSDRRWEFPDGYWTWVTEEAVTYALYLLETRDARAELERRHTIAAARATDGPADHRPAWAVRAEVYAEALEVLGGGSC